MSAAPPRDLRTLGDLQQLIGSMPHGTVLRVAKSRYSIAGVAWHSVSIVVPQENRRDGDDWEFRGSDSSIDVAILCAYDQYAALVVKTSKPVDEAEIIAYTSAGATQCQGYEQCDPARFPFVPTTTTGEDDGNG